VRRQGDRAVLRYTKRFDHLDLRRAGFTVPAEEIREAYRTVPRGCVQALRQAARNIRTAARRQLPAAWRTTTTAGVRVSQIVRALERVACYVPGGRFPLPSTVLMSVIPAQVAGVREVVITSPRPAPAVLVAADVLGVKKIFRLGGAQAVAAFAYGTESVPRADKIVGPGNRYVAAPRNCWWSAPAEIRAGLRLTSSRRRSTIRMRLLCFSLPRAAWLYRFREQRRTSSAN